MTDCINQESPSRIKKRKADNERASSDEEKRSKSSVTSLNNASPLNGLDYQIGSPAWLKKKITAYMLERLLVSTIVPQNQLASCLNQDN